MIIEKSPSDKSRCRWCYDYILKDEPRVKFFSNYENHSSYYCMHLRCFLSLPEGRNFFNNIIDILLPFYFSGNSEALEHIKRLEEISKILEMSKSLGRKEI